MGYGSTGEISQSFSGSASKYLISFDYKANPGIAGPTANVTFDGTGLGQVTGTSTWQISAEVSQPSVVGP